MNTIERAALQLSAKPEKSLIERAADRLLGTASTALAEPVPEKAVAAKPSRKTRRQVELDFARLRAMGLALPGDQTAVAEEFRLIKRPLLRTGLSPASGPPRNANVIMITSARPGEGKTFVALNLAFSMTSEHDLHVLLVDGDFPSPGIPRVLGFEADAGLIDVVGDVGLDLADVMIRTNVDNLTILPSGPTRPGSTELLASARMARFVDDLSTRYPDRIIIFDSPPVLARSEPTVLAKHVGQVVVVMEAERTSRTALEEAISLIGPDRIAGVVLNKAPAIARDQFGSYSKPQG